MRPLISSRGQPEPEPIGEHNHRDGQGIKEFRGACNKACKKAKIGKMLFDDFRRTQDFVLLPEAVDAKGKLEHEIHEGTHIPRISGSWVDHIPPPLLQHMSQEVPWCPLLQGWENRPAICIPLL